MDATDARLLLALAQDPRASALALAERLGISRNTVQARLARLDLSAVQLRLDPAELGYPITAYVTMVLRQRRLDDVAAELAEVPEVIEVLGISGETDLLVQVAARDGDDLYRVAGRLLAIDGVQRTTTSLVMRTLVPHRLTPLLERVAGRQPG
ncbi:Lrp/AsnC family transcriptional regulator [Pseudonocardia sp. CA-107938]|uniref:Lrp/AsnC family transcriptional regulator n=1 Tax=Pseudonocardia sp. CA-107938 TaxID=3240021 RepID=UPI003D91B947